MTAQAAKTGGHSAGGSNRISGYDGNYYATTLTENREWPALDGAQEAEVCVVGGGLAGVNTLLGLRERGIDAVLLESARIGWGASGRNAGFVAKGYAAGEGSLLAKYGMDKAKTLVSLTKNARSLIRERIQKYDIDCGPVIDGVLTVAWHDQPGAIVDAINTANDHFDLGFEFKSRQEVREMCRTSRYHDGIFSPHDYQMNPLKFLRGLAAAADKIGGRIFEQSAVTSLTKDGAGWLVKTAAGSVRAKHVVLSTAVYGDAVDKRLQFAAIPVQTYIMVTEPISEDVYAASLNTRYAIYDSRFCSDYYRRLPEGRLLWGGRVGLFAHPDNIAAAMTEDMLKVYPQLRGIVKPAFAWSGLLSYAAHKMPMIGKLEDGLWYNTGYGGHGICPTTAGGEIVAAAIAAGDTGYRAFDDFRLSFTGGKAGRYGAQMVYLWWKLRDHLNI
jgi:gamma-glutamylputrescine oxidase